MQKLEWIRCLGPSLALAVAAFGCTGPGETGRSAWLWSTLRDDARVYIERTPDLAAARFRLMDSNPHAFLRGTLGQYLRDATEGTETFPPSAFGHGAAAEVLLMGDPHLENLGTFRPSTPDDTPDDTPALVLDFNDFDAAGYGPYPWDVRRLSLSVELALRMAGVAERAAAVRAVAEGYVEEIAAEAAGDPPFVPGPEDGEIVQWLLEKAEEAGRAREELDDDTELVDGTRRLRLGELAPREAGVISRAQQAPNAAERAMVAAAFADYRTRLGLRGPAFEVQDVARRLGAGIASYAALRYTLLLPGPTDAPEDDVLLEMKEVPVLRPMAPGLAAARRPFPSEAARVVAATRAFQTTPQNDLYLGAAEVPPQAFRLRDRTAFQKGLNIDKFLEKSAEGKWRPADVEALARTAGRLLARGHALAPGRRGAPGLAALDADLAGRSAAFISETAGFAARYADTVEADAAAFHTLLETRGPLLGARP